MIRFRGVGETGEANLDGKNQERNEAEARRLYEIGLSKLLADPEASLPLLRECLALIEGGGVQSGGAERLQYLALCNLARGLEASTKNPEKDYLEARDCYIKVIIDSI